jgi:hypothetical protein
MFGVDQQPVNGQASQQTRTERAGQAQPDTAAGFAIREFAFDGVCAHGFLRWVCCDFTTKFVRLQHENRTQPHYL